MKQVIIFILISSCFSLALAAEKTKAAPVNVETVTVQLVSHPDQISATGTLISIPGIIVKPEISGRVTKIYFKSGEVVSTSTPLIEINPEIIKAQLAEAEAALNLNRLNFSRSTALYKTHDIAKSDFDQAKANYDGAQAKVASVLAQLQQTTVVAPFAGKLGLSQVNVGDYINVGQSIVNLQTLDPLKVDFSIPELYQNRVAIGQTVLLHTDSNPGKTFSGQVEAVESLINQNNRTLNVRANIPNKNGELIPGGFAEVTLRFAEERLIMVPQTAIVYSLGGNYVFKVVANQAEKVMVTLGSKDSNNVVIQSGLKVGELIITSGQTKIYPGSPVLVNENKKT